MIPVAFQTAEDRSLRVPAGHVVRTGWVEVFKVRLANRAPIAIGDVEAAHRKRLQAGRDAPFPCPNGMWDGETFVIFDGRHEWVATVMLGHERLLVAWVEKEATGSSPPWPQRMPPRSTGRLADD